MIWKDYVALCDLFKMQIDLWFKKTMKFFYEVFNVAMHTVYKNYNIL